MIRSFPESSGFNLLPVSLLAGVLPLSDINVLFFKTFWFVLEIILDRHNITFSKYGADGDRLMKISSHHFLLVESSCGNVESFSLSEELRAPDEIVTILLEHPLNHEDLRLHPRLSWGGVDEVPNIILHSISSSPRPGLGVSLHHVIAILLRHLRARLSLLGHLQILL